MPLATLHVRESSVEAGAELIPCLLSPHFVSLLSLRRQPSEDVLVAQRFPIVSELLPELVWSALSPVFDQNLGRKCSKTSHIIEYKS